MQPARRPDLFVGAGGRGGVGSILPKWVKVVFESRVFKGLRRTDFLERFVPLSLST